jgi:hypothetical protein
MADDKTEDGKDDEALIRKSEELYKEERLLVAADLLRQVKDVSLLSEHHVMMIRWADAVQNSMADLLDDPFDSATDVDGGGAEVVDDKDGAAGDKKKERSSQQKEKIPWKKQSETHGHRDYVVFYHLTDHNLLTSRIECPIESSLLIPILSVFNESQLYNEWMPSWKAPIKLGIDYTNKLKETGRGNQIIQVGIALAWPFSNRELCMHVVAVDVIDEEGCIAIHAKSETSVDDPVIPSVPKNVIPIDYSCSILVRACPPDHPCLKSSKNEYPAGESLVLFSLKMTADPHVKAVPQGLQNFITRTVIGRFWSSMLQVAEEVRDGKRPAHKEAIDGKRELYDWIDARIDVLLQKMKEEK